MAAAKQKAVFKYQITITGYLLNIKYLTFLRVCV